MRTRSFLFFCLGCIALAPAANAITTVGAGRLVGTAGARVDYDSNIFVNNSEVDDIIGTLLGTLTYRRDGGVIPFEAGAGLTLLGFADHDDQNTADYYFDSKIGYNPSGKTEMFGIASFRRSSIANEILNTRTKSNDLLLEGSIQHLTTEKLGFRLKGEYGSNDYLTTGYSDVLHYSVGLHGVHIYSPKLKLLAGITHLEWWTDDRAAGRQSPSSRDWRYTVGAEGELAPKVTGEVTGGIVQREVKNSGFSDDNALYLAGRMRWVPAQKTAYTLLVSRDLTLNAADQTMRSLLVTLSATQDLSEKVTIEGSAGIDQMKLSGYRGLGDRTDKGYIVRGRVNYVFTDAVSLDLSAGYRDNDSTIAFSTYGRFNVGVGVTSRF